MYETAIEEVLLKDSETKKFFIGTFARDELPSKINFPCCLVLNLQRFTRCKRFTYV